MLSIAKEDIKPPAYNCASCPGAYSSQFGGVPINPSLAISIPFK
jgi:hypothetical protein